MTVNNVNNYQQYRKQYLRLSTTINRHQQKGLDTSELLQQREQLKSVYSIQQNSIQSTVNKSQLVNSVDNVNSLPTVNNVNKSKLFTELLNQQKEQWTKIEQSLGEIKELLTTIVQQPRSLSPIVNSQPKPLEPKKVVPSVAFSKPVAPSSPNNKMTFLFNKEVFSNIQTFLSRNSSFASFSHLVRAALIAYQQGMVIDKQFLISTSKKDCLKKSLRIDNELQNIYRSLTEGQKTLILNQILSSFLIKD